MTALHCSVDGCNAATTRPDVPEDGWTCQSCRLALSLVACTYCGRDAATCGRIPGRCCGSCSHRREVR